MREHRQTWTNSVKDVKDPFVNTVTRARHARAYTADKGEPFTSFTDASGVAVEHAMVDGVPPVVLALDLVQRLGWGLRAGASRLGRRCRRLRRAAARGATCALIREGGSLARHLPQTSPSEEELLSMCRLVWRKQGIVVVRLADVRDETIRQALLNEPTRLYGQGEFA